MTKAEQVQPETIALIDGNPTFRDVVENVFKIPSKYLADLLKQHNGTDDRIAVTLKDSGNVLSKDLQIFPALVRFAERESQEYSNACMV